MILQASDILRLTTTTAASVSVFAAFEDIGKTKSTRGRQSTSIGSATTTTVVAAPGGATTRSVSTLIVANTHASLSAGVTIQHYDGTTATTLWSGTLAPGESLKHCGDSCLVFNASGVPKAAPVVGTPQSSVLCPPFFSTANLTGTKTITSASTFAVYLGRAPRSLASVSLRYRVTTAAATITWAELAIAKGSISIGANPTLTVVGYADVAAVVNTTGQKTTAVNVSAGQNINEGDDLWALVGNAATTALVVRAMSIADDLQVGVQASLATRPSLNVGNGQAYTLEGATTLGAWIAGVV